MEEKDVFGEFNRIPSHTTVLNTSSFLRVWLNKISSRYFTMTVEHLQSAENISYLLHCTTWPISAEQVHQD